MTYCKMIHDKELLFRIKKCVHYDIKLFELFKILIKKLAIRNICSICVHTSNKTNNSCKNKFKTDDSPNLCNAPPLKNKNSTDIYKCSIFVQDITRGAYCLTLIYFTSIYYFYFQCCHAKKS